VPTSRGHRGLPLVPVTHTMGNAAVLARREKVCPRWPHPRPGRADRGCQMHGQSRPALTSTHDSALIFQPLRDVAGHGCRDGHVRPTDLTRGQRVAWAYGAWGEPDRSRRWPGCPLCLGPPTGPRRRRHAFGTVTQTFELHLVDLSSTQIRTGDRIQSCHACHSLLSGHEKLGHGSLGRRRRWERLLRGQRPPACPPPPAGW